MWQTQAQQYSYKNDYRRCKDHVTELARWEAYAEISLQVKQYKSYVISVDE
jgi:hypothetical protein